jgi:hypothetical protein
MFNPVSGSAGAYCQSLVNRRTAAGLLCLPLRSQRLGIGVGRAAL